ncbi:RluA family pseudouridine synthase [Edaphobacter modestus]|uniref:Pseudouridine synthase n=1 Tax=Edaphobacter modestus TaxID=388466 RepID=A0A4Q7YYM0_9BACT|nr:RluA family pseudouridine synthase [Edaphobacter modestus]RZU42293.1 ribosomal large subunit pseudouridine synthase D [Edaphobacter modestus]
MPSKNMLPKGQRRRTVKPEYRATRGVEPTAPPVIPVLEIEDDAGERVRAFTAPSEAAGLRLDQYLSQAIPDISRARVQLLIEHGQVRVSGQVAKAKLKLQGGEPIEIDGAPHPPPLHAFPEDIPLDILYEDDHLAVIDKPAGMMVHAGAGVAAPGEEPDERNHGTLVNALLHHFNKLSHVGGDLRPGIVHRLDKQTSGIIVVAKEDSTHRKLSEMFASRELEKTYLALVHGTIARDTFIVNLPIGRDLVRRTRMTTRRSLESEGVRSALSHMQVLERIRSARYGQFTLVEVRIETGRTHQIRVHLQALGHPVVGDTLYGAPHQFGRPQETLSLDRNFLHAARLVFQHPRTRKTMTMESPLPSELVNLLAALRAD